MHKQLIFLFENDKIIINNLKELGYVVISKKENEVLVVRELPFNDSLVGSAKHIDDMNSNYFELLSAKKEQKLQELLAIRVLLYQKNYRKLKKKYQKENNRLLTQINKLTIKNTRIEKSNIKGLLDSNSFDEELISNTIKQTQANQTEVYNSVGYQNLIKEYEAFIEDNYLLKMSTMFYKNSQEFKKQKSKKSDFYGLPVIIDDAIAEFESKVIKAPNEAVELKEVFFTILQEAKHFTLIYSSNKATDYQIIAKREMGSLTIEDLATLKINQGIEITR